MRDIEKRLGRFLISDEMLRKNPRAVQRILSKVIVVRCEYLYPNRAFEYIAQSERFDVVEEGLLYPTYTGVINNGFVSFNKNQY